MTFTTVSRLKRSETQTPGGCSVLAKKGATEGAINVGEVVGDAQLLALSSRANLLRYVRPQGRGPPPSGDALTYLCRLCSAAYIWREKWNFKFGIYLYLCRNVIVFVLNLVYLCIKLRSITLFLKFCKFVTWKFLKFKDIFNTSFKKVLQFRVCMPSCFTRISHLLAIWIQNFLTLSVTAGHPYPT